MNDAADKIKEELKTAVVDELGQAGVVDLKDIIRIIDNEFKALSDQTELENRASTDTLIDARAAI